VRNASDEDEFDRNRSLAVKKVGVQRSPSRLLSSREQVRWETLAGHALALISSARRPWSTSDSGLRMKKLWQQRLLLP
jgi:hypothetical protein